MPLPQQTQPRRVIIDTDPGVDDALALLLAVRSPELHIEAITAVSGNVHVDKCVTNVFRVFDAVGIEAAPPVARGCESPLRHDTVSSEHVHGDDGLGGISLLRDDSGAPRYPVPPETPCGDHAVDVILSSLRESPGEVTIVALGPLTNIATAMQRDPAAMHGVEQLIVMGGSLCGIGNVTAAAEFNFYADPEAAQIVLRSGMNITLVGLDVTHDAVLSRKRFEQALESDTGPYAGFLRDLTAHYFDFAATWGDVGAYLHDPLAIGVAIDPTFVRTQEFHADVETKGSLTRGMLVADRRRSASPQAPNIRGCVEVDAERFVRFFLSRVVPSSRQA